MIGSLIDLARHFRFRRLLIFAHDLIIVTCAFPISIVLRENFEPGPQHVQPAIYGTLILFATSLMVLRVMGVQQNMWRYSSPSDLMEVAKALFVITAIFFAAMFLVDRLDGISRSVLIIFWLVAFAGLCSTRIIYSSVINSYRRRVRGNGQTMAYRVLLQADLEASPAIIQTLNYRYRHQVEIVGIICEDGGRGRTLQGAEILGRARDMPQILASLDVAGCYPHAIVVSGADQPILPGLSTKLELADIDLPIVKSSAIDQLPDVIDRNRFPAELSSCQLVNQRHYAKAKRFIDIAAALLALIFLLPLLLLVTFVTSVLDGTPILFTQIRAGKHLQEFRLLKFRSMRVPFDSKGRLLNDQERVTWFGSFLRRARIDELPQFWNVLKGDMSLIGPRPLLQRDMPKETVILEERYSIRPGITGWAQVNGGKMIENDNKMTLDLFYIRNFSLYLDIIIILMTIKTVMFGETINHRAIQNAKELVTNN